MSEPISLSKIAIDLLVGIAEKQGGKLLDITGDTAAKLRQGLSINFTRYFDGAVELRRIRLFGQLPGRNKLKAGSRLLV